MGGLRWGNNFQNLFSKLQNYVFPLKVVKYLWKVDISVFRVDNTRDLKGLRVDSPCNNLFRTAIDL